MSSKAQRLIVFYDANCFANIPFEELRFIIGQSNNKIISTTLDEIRKAWQNYPRSPQFELIFKKGGKLKKNFQMISLSSIQKKPVDPITQFTKTSTIYLKENPIVCSAYYTWLPSALNPATITDINRHIFNNLLFELRMGKNVPNDWYKIEQKVRKKEIEDQKKASELLGHTGGLDPSWILKSRDKRIKEVKKDNFKLADYQLLVCAFLYACIMGCHVYILTCDRDFLDIHENLMRNLIERYTIYSLLERRIECLNHRDKLAYYNNRIEIPLKKENIFTELENVVYKIKTSETNLQFYFGILYFKPDDGKLYFNINIIPIWLRDFALEYKANIDCFSLDSKTEMKYPIKFVMDPTKSSKYVYFIISHRKQQFYPFFLPDCEYQCKYALTEKNTPNKLTDFLSEPISPNSSF